MKSLNGEYKITLDDKGRLSLPTKIRTALEDNNHMLTKGPDGCIWLYPMEEWNKLMQKVRTSSSAFNSDFRALRRHLIGPAQDVEIDKAGRIAIPQTLREYAELIRDCIVLGQDDFVEIWNADRYRSYETESKEEYEIAYEKLGAALLREKDGE
ncbi:division/cell wall cluster transcriptional repressor MraZ [Treponema primitia]|uniref:division/cell wall cluster transcriptional repressor MraZ n=1 Tax=Treponema primitia TaxID=88058 RepID=UPI003980EFB2